MKKSKFIADRVREVYLSGTWVANTNFKDQLARVTWKEALTKVGRLHSIAALTFHVNYYLGGLIRVLEGGPLDIRDQYSFDLPPITTVEAWEALVGEFLENAETFATLIEHLPDSKMEESFVDEKYGSYARNLEGIIEHGYYHLGQVSLIRKMLQE